MGWLWDVYSVDGRMRQRNEPHVMTDHLFTIQTDLSAALRIPEPEIRHTTSAQPTRMISFHLRTREIELIAQTDVENAGDYRLGLADALQPSFVVLPSSLLLSHLAYDVPRNLGVVDIPD
jgi:hypothetical protein